MVSITLEEQTATHLQFRADIDHMAHSASNPQILRQFSSDLVKEAFRQRAIGSNSRFEELRRAFATKPTAPDATTTTQLGHLLVALTHQISLFDDTSVPLVKSILALNWLGRDVHFVQTYTRFLGALVSAHAEFSRLVVQMLIQHMNRLHRSVGQVPNHVEVGRDQIYARVHAALAYVLELVPFVRESIVAIVLGEFPHKSEDVTAQATYIENLLKMASYLPNTERAIVGIIIEKVIAIDVEIQVDLEDLDIDPDDVVDQGADTFEEAVELVEDESEASDDEVQPPDMSVQMINANIRKLDQMLAIVFDYFHRIFDDLPVDINQPGGTQRYTHAESVFAALLYALDNIILKTFQSKYTQFLLFWAAQKHKDFTDDFLGVIVDRALDHNRPATHRMIAASYIGSFTARAATLDRASVRMLTSQIMFWINGFLDGKEEVNQNNTRGAVQRFGVFYAMMQALFYVYCFRWRELQGLYDFDEDDDEANTMSWMPGLQRTIERAIYNRQLNPLKFCNANIVSQFAKVSHHLNFIFCGTIIESNKRSSQVGVGEIDSYFPFDPYGLSKTRHYIDAVYQTWRKIPGMQDDDDDDEDDDDDDEDMEE